MIEIGPNRYGKSAIRLVRVVRGPDRHVVRDLTVAIALEGAFGPSYTAGDNSEVIATDTMKNTVYAFAHEHLTGAIEGFGLVLARHFLANDQVERVTVTIEEQAWSPIEGAPDAFARDQVSTRTAVVMAASDDETVDAGIAGLTVMKTSKSAFAGFPRDAWTTLPDTDDRLLATKVTATWRYASATGVDFDASYASVRQTILATFAEHHSPSVQATIWLIGQAVLEAHPEVAEITQTMPNLHHWLVDLGPFGQVNDREVFIATTEPHGLIQATVRRGS